jgi:hypothetical protein
MNHREDINTCHFGDQLISVIYLEASEREASEFRAHMQTCKQCEVEVREFGEVRESIGSWKFEALSGTADATEVNLQPQTSRTKSAVAALREFFDLSPLWLKGATAFATVLFCLLAALALVRFQQSPQATVVNSKPDAIYTQQEKDLLVQKALDQQRAEILAQTAPAPEKIKIAVNQSEKPTTRPNTIVKGRRPLAKWEREQLAADLRLLKRHDDDIELLSDPINR